MDFARPKEATKPPIDTLKEKLLKCTPQTDKHLIDNCSIIREVIREFMKNKEFIPLHEELIKLGNEANLWDTKYYVEELGVSEEGGEATDASLDKGEVEVGIKLKEEMKHRKKKVVAKDKKEAKGKSGVKKKRDKGKKRKKSKREGEKDSQDKKETKERKDSDK